MIKLLLLREQFAGDLAQAYRVAGQSVLTNAALNELLAFKRLWLASTWGRSRPARDFSRVRAGLVYRGPGWIANQWREVECHSTPDGYQVGVRGAGVFLVTPDGLIVVQTEAGVANDYSLWVETVLGPVLILALALQGTFCLHASAVRCGAGAIAFAGESGNGKSTLAAFLGNGDIPDWQRLADDILPLEAAADGLRALPHFPQLKLPPDAQPATGHPQQMPLQAIYLLNPPEVGRAAAEIGRLSKQEAALALVRHTVAARLFGPHLLARHMAFCTAAAVRVPVRHLAIPRDLRLLPRVRDLLIADVASQQDAA